MTPVQLGARYAQLQQQIAADPPADIGRYVSCLVSERDVIEAARNGTDTPSPLWLIRVTKGKKDLLAKMGWYYTDATSFTRRATLSEAAYDLALFTLDGSEAQLFRVDV